MRTNLATVERVGVEFLAPLRDPNSAGNQREFAMKLVAQARDCGLSMREFLTLKIDPSKSATPAQFANDNQRLSGYEAALAYLNLPVRDCLREGVMLQAAANTFQTFPGTRVLFPEVVDDVARFKFRQTPFERLDPMLGNTRTIDGNEMLMMVVEDAAADYRKARAVSEGGRFPIHSIRGTDKSVKIWKFGLGWEFTYEFERRASLDIMTPYALKSEREIERAKVETATSILINGDGNYGAATEIDQSTYNSKVGAPAATNGQISYRHLLAWLVARAQAGFPIDTVVGNFDAYLQWLMMFATPTANSGEQQAETLARAGFQVRGVPILQGSVDFVLSSTAPANKLIGYSRADTLEQLIETGSQITENERSIKTQRVTYVRSENSGFRLVFDETRSVYDFGN